MRVRMGWVVGRSGGGMGRSMVGMLVLVLGIEEWLGVVGVVGREEEVELPGVVLLA